ncbi:MAG: hypothetical protein R2932_59120 [Caldilineaceae bacterium]
MTTMAKRRGLGHARRCRRTPMQNVVRVQLQLARQKLQDIKTWRTGDDNRFGRMVDGRGKQLGDLNLWLEHINNTLARPEVWQYQPGAAKRIARELTVMGYQVKSTFFRGDKQ